MLAPKCRFVLLTQAASHQELAALECANVRCVQVLGHAPQAGTHPVALNYARRLFGLAPSRVRRLLLNVVYRFRRHGRHATGMPVLHEIGADLLFCPFTAPTYAEPGVATVCIVHDLQYKTYPQFFRAEDIVHRDRSFMEACGGATLLVAISEYTRESALRWGNLEPERVRTVHHRLAGRFRARDEVENAPALERFALRRGRYLLYPGNFWKHKNHEMLLTAFGIAARGDFPEDIRLVCTGAPGERQLFLAGAASAMGLGDRVIFPGYVEAAELGALLGSSLGVVFPSLYEGFGLPVLEARAAGVPVACSSATSLPEVAAGAAILFDPRVTDDVVSALIALATDAALRESLVAAGLRRATEFADAQRMAAEYWAVFQSAVSGPRRTNSISGVYEDGWAGVEVRIEVVAPVPSALLKLEVQAPGWLPHAGIAVELVRDGSKRRKCLRLRRGERACWSFPVDDGLWRLRIGPGFVPAHCGQGEDLRELTLIVLHCELSAPDAPSEILFGQVCS
jgi:glycosyltransferase involved in cell wall biosynthesis